MRKARITAENGGYYHCISRIIEQRYYLGPTEKERFYQTMRKYEGFCGVHVLTYGVLDNHWHIVLEVPAKKPVSDTELIRRLSFLYQPFKVKQVSRELQDYRQNGQHDQAEALKVRYTYRMYDLSEFFKGLKQSFSQWYNKRHDRTGTLWESRFKSLLVEGADPALLTVAGYVDLNACRAGLVRNPQDYRYCGYGEAVAGSKQAREGILRVMQGVSAEASWQRVQCLYRKHLYLQGQEKGLDESGKVLHDGFTREQVQEVLDAGGRLPMRVLLRCRVRYFSDGLVLGSKGFVEEVFARNREQFGAKRTNGARVMKHGNWKGLYTLRALRLDPVSTS
jgi:REP element-mobilizing transposase RayT